MAAASAAPARKATKRVQAPARGRGWIGPQRIEQAERIAHHGANVFPNDHFPPSSSLRGDFRDIRRIGAGSRRRQRGEARQIARIEQIVDGEADGLQGAVESREFQPSLAIEKIRDVRLGESGAVRQFHAGELAGVDALAKFSPERLLQGT